MWCGKTEEKTEITHRSAPMTGGFLEMSSSCVYAEYIEHLGKWRQGTYLCASGGTENTVDVFRSMSQVVVSPAGRAAEL